MHTTATEKVASRPARFISLTHDDDGSMIVYCSRTGAIGTVPPEQVDTARAALLPGTAGSAANDPAAYPGEAFGG